MKIKTSWLQEMRGSLGRPFMGGMNCFRTDKYGNIVGLRKPYPSRLFVGKQPIYQHQLYALRKYWAFLTPSEKAAYQQKAIELDLSAYNVFIKENYPKTFLKMFPAEDTHTNQYHPNSGFSSWRQMRFSDKPDGEARIFMRHPYNLLTSELTITKAELWLFYTTEAAWSPTGKRVDCHRITESWDDYIPTWNNSPAFDATETDHTTMPGEEEWFSLDVTSDIQNIISGSEPGYGWLIKFHELDPVEDSVSDIAAIQEDEYPDWNYLKLIL